MTISPGKQAAADCQSCSPAKSSDRLFWADVLRVCAAFAVVMIHSGFSRPIPGPSPHGINELLITATSLIVRPAVIWFFFLSGALLIPRDESLCDFLSKRLLKIAWTAVFWSAVYLGFLILTGSFFQMDSIWSLFVGGCYYHLWFLHAILVVYLTMPFLRLVQGHTDLLVWFLIVWGMAAYIIPVVAQVVGGEPADFSYDRDYLVGYIGFPVIGFALSSYAPRFTTRWLALAWFVPTTALLVAVTNFHTGFNLIYSYKSPLLVLYAAAGFLLARSIPNIAGATRTHRLIGWLAPCTFGIYLIHPLFLKALGSVPGLGHSDEFVAILGRATITFVISATCIHWLRCTKPGRWVCP